jgi:hypothetical protein
MPEIETGSIIRTISEGTARERLAVISDILSIFGISLLGILTPALTSKTESELATSWRWLMAGGIFLFWAGIFGALLYTILKIFEKLSLRWTTLRQYRVFLLLSIFGLFLAFSIAALEQLKEWVRHPNRSYVIEDQSENVRP